MKSKFFSITKIYQGLYEKVQSLSIDDKQKKKYAVKQYADEILEHGNFEPFFKLVKNGYTPTIAQNKKISDLFIEYVNKPNTALPTKMIEYGYEPDLQTFAKMFLSNGFLWAGLDHLKKKTPYEIVAHSKYPGLNYTTIFNYVSKKIDEPTYQKAVFEEWRNQVVSGKKDSYEKMTEGRVISVYSYFMNAWFKDMPKEQYKQLIDELNQASIKAEKLYIKHSSSHAHQCHKWLKTLSVNMSANLSHYYSNELTEMLETTKQVYLDNVVNNAIANSQKKKTEQYQVNKLPQEARQVIGEIENQYIKVGAILNLDEEKKFVIANLMEQRLPEVIRKYFSIDEEYRHTLKNHEGKDAQQLLVDSLHQIGNVLQNTIEHVNEEKLTHLTVDNRYMHAVKKAF